MFDRFADRLRERFKKQGPSPAAEAPVEEGKPTAPSGGSAPSPLEPVTPAAEAASPPCEAEPPAQTPVEEAPREETSTGEAPAETRAGFMQRLQQGLQRGIAVLNTDVTELIPVPASTELFDRLKSGLRRTRESLVGNVTALFSRGQRIDEAFWESLEEILITSDVGVQTSTRLVDHLRAVVKERHLTEPAELTEVLRQDLEAMLRDAQSDLRLRPEGELTVIMVVGVNGTGKTTTIGKLAAQLKAQGRKVMLGAADTFRAAAIEQLQSWADRCGVDMVRLSDGADPAAVAWDALQAARARGMDVLIVDTAGRLQNKANLMEELKKVHRVLGRQMEGAPHEVLLVLDATTGQNALQQARVFTQVVGVTGLVLAKLDGTARGGIVLAIAQELGLPVKFIGIGEGIDDLRPFDATDFLAALFANGESAEENSASAS